MRSPSPNCADHDPQIMIGAKFDGNLMIVAISEPASAGTLGREGPRLVVTG
jgi:hypothetical protein